MKIYKNNFETTTYRWVDFVEQKIDEHPKKPSFQTQTYPSWRFQQWTSMPVNLDHLPKDRGENSKNVWNHHLAPLKNIPQMVVHGDLPRYDP